MSTSTATGVLIADGASCDEESRSAVTVADARVDSVHVDAAEGVFVVAIGGSFERRCVSIEPIAMFGSYPERAAAVDFYVPSVDEPVIARIQRKYIGEPTGQWLDAKSLDSQSFSVRRSPRWRPPPAVQSTTVSEVQDFFVADGDALAAMDAAEKRHAKAMSAELDHDREARIYYRP